jgi:flagellar protein FliO/FliZ
MTLIGITAVLVLTYFFSRWYAGGMGRPPMAGKHIKLIDRLVIGKASSILIIEIAGVQYLVGVTEQGVSVLKELEEPITVEDAGRGPALGGLAFRDILAGRGKGKGGR